jgi:type I restriction enzyme M protein
MKRPMSAHSQGLVQRLWNYCTVLRDGGLSYGDYVEQLTYLLFLKMAHERTVSHGEPSRIPKGLDWPTLVSEDGADLEAKYVEILQSLGRQPGLLGLIFRKAQNRIQNPALLKRLVVDLIEPETWTGIDADVKGDVYEGLLEKNAADTKSGAGQYFTPRALIKAVVDVVRPRPGMTIADPACGTGGFLLAAHDFIVEPGRHDLDRDDKKFLRDRAFHGVELVDNTARLCAMNLFLHGIGGASFDADPCIEVRDSLATAPSTHYDLVLANPPFGKKSSITMIGADSTGSSDSDLAVSRPDFWATTSNKQLNFLQHIVRMLKIGGSAAVVLPDNVLYEGGAGAKIRERLMYECDLHTMLRLPTGIFYAQGVKANVLFFDRKVASETSRTKEVWVYDFRTNKHFTLKTRQMKRSHLDGFVNAYCADDRSKRVESEQFKRWSYDDISKRPGFNLDVWASVKDESLTDAASLLPPEEIAIEIVERLASALEKFQLVAEELQANGDDGDEAQPDAIEALLPTDE